MSWAEPVGQSQRKAAEEIDENSRRHGYAIQPPDGTGPKSYGVTADGIGYALRKPVQEADEPEDGAQ